MPVVDGRGSLPAAETRVYFSAQRELDEVSTGARGLTDKPDDWKTYVLCYEDCRHAGGKGWGGRIVQTKGCFVIRRICTGTFLAWKTISIS